MDVLSCFLVRRRIGAYLDGGLADRAADRVATHLSRCNGCRGEADTLRRLRTMLQRVLTAPEPDWTGFWPGVVRGIEDRRHAAPVRHRRPGWLQPKWALGGALAAVLVGSLTFWQMSPGPVPFLGRVVVSSANTEDPRATVMVYSTPEQDVAVVWVFGLD
jgi:predicted anti-sigma-YlaC factor YlaD